MAVKKSRRPARKIKKWRPVKRPKHTRPAQQAKRGVQKRSFKRPWKALSAYPFKERPVKRQRTSFPAPKGTAGEYVRNIVKRGRPVRSTVSSIAKLGLNPRIVRFQAVNALERYGSTVTGAYDCNFVNTGAPASPANWQLPLYFFALNAVTQGSAPVLFYRTSMTGTTITMNALNGVAENGSSLTQTWSTEYARVQGAVSASRYVQNKWYDIRLMLHNATSQPTVFRIDIVQFLDETSDPIEIVGNVTATTQQLEDRRATYLALVKDMVNHPMIPQRSHLKRVRFLKSYKVAMAAEHNTEENASPNHREFRIFYNDGRINDYQPYSNPTSFQELGDPNAWGNEGVVTTDYVPFPRPLGRTYLMIRALDTGYSGPVIGTDYTPFKNGAFEGANVVNEATPTSQNSPSFDLIVRKKEVRSAP